MKISFTSSIAEHPAEPAFVLTTNFVGLFVLASASALFAICLGWKCFHIFHRSKKPMLDFSRIQPLLAFDHTSVPPRAYRPWKTGKYNMTMGIRKMPEDEWLIIDKLYMDEQKVKQYLLENDIQAVLQCLPDAEDACIETLECVVGFMIRRYPDHFKLLKKQPGYIYNAITRRSFRIVKPFEQHPLVIAAQLAMEDINLLIQGSGDESRDYNLQASFSFAPAGWYIQERIGWPLWRIHAPVPLWNDKLRKSMEKFFLGLKVSRPVERNNYFIQTNDNLFQQEPFPEELPVPPKIEDIHVRYERQTLRRLPRSRAIVFCVRTYLMPLLDLRDEKDSLYTLRAATRAWPAAMAKYKGRQAWEEVFESWCKEVLSDYTPRSEKADV